MTSVRLIFAPTDEAWATAGVVIVATPTAPSAPAVSAMLRLAAKRMSFMFSLRFVGRRHRPLLTG
jgi:hypothetical protein